MEVTLDGGDAEPCRAALQSLLDPLVTFEDHMRYATITRADDRQVD